MVKAILLPLVLVLLALVVTGCQNSGTAESELKAPPAPGAFASTHDDDDDDGDDDDGDDEETIPLADVPADATDAALAAVPGLVITRAERETEHGQIVYGLEGSVDGMPHEVEVTAAGEVIEIDVGEDDD